MFPSNHSHPPNFRYPSHQLSALHQEPTSYNMRNTSISNSFTNNTCMYSDEREYKKTCIDCNQYCNKYCNNMSPSYMDMQSQKCTCFHPQYQSQEQPKLVPSTHCSESCPDHIQTQQQYTYPQQQIMDYAQNNINNINNMNNMNLSTNGMNINGGYMNNNNNNNNTNNAFDGNVHNEQEQMRIDMNCTPYCDGIVSSMPYNYNSLSMPSSTSSSTILNATNTEYHNLISSKNDREIITKSSQQKQEEKQQKQKENQEDLSKKHVCDKCGKRFRYLSLLDRHITSHSSAKPFPCDYKGCNKRFQHKYYLHQHIRRTHEAVKRHQCPECDKAFVEKCNLKIHLRKHTGEKPYQCALCLRRFSVKTNLDAHLRIHNNEKPFKCEICDKRFARKAYLTQHKRVHTGEKPFECQYCGKRCSQVGDLKKHIRIHTGEKPYKCDVCLKKFRYSSHLKSHSRKLHPNSE